MLWSSPLTAGLWWNAWLHTARDVYFTVSQFVSQDGTSHISMLTPYGIYELSIAKPAGSMTRRVNGMENTGVIRKFSRMQLRRKGSDASTLVTG